jgi:geranylgeranyl pyrophosphate synthase
VAAAGASRGGRVTVDLRDHFADQLRRIGDRMRAGFEFWPWDHRDRMRVLVERQLARKGKRLRPTFALLCGELLGGDAKRVEPVAAAVELYHCASLVLDDVQDNSAFRGSDQAVHVSESVSNAINLGCIVRSFSHYPVHRSDLTLAEKDGVRHQLDVMATLVPLGQSMDIGWHQGWYDFRSVPYYEMIRLKTGAPFACVASCAAVTSGVDGETRAGMERLGYAVGTLYQLIDDYLDMFLRADTESGDLAEGKFTRPIAILVELLCAAGDEELAGRVAAQLLKPNGDAAWIRDLMLTRSVAPLLAEEIRRRAGDINRQVTTLARGGPPATARMAAFVGALVGMLRER